MVKKKTSLKMECPQDDIVYFKYLLHRYRRIVEKRPLAIKKPLSKSHPNTSINTVNTMAHTVIHYNIIHITTIIGMSAVTDRSPRSIRAPAAAIQTPTRPGTLCAARGACVSWCASS